MPGTELSNLENESKIPILLIQNAINNNNHSLKNGNLYSGWDLILPCSWGMSFWLTLIHHGARALGQNEIDYLSFESGNLQFPNEFLDTRASQIKADELNNQFLKKYLLKPPSKRVNYLKLGFLSPFYFPLRSIVSFNNKCFDLNNSCYFILRNKLFLTKLIDKIFNKNHKHAKQNCNLLNALNEAEIKNLDKSFVCVRLTPIDKGKIEKFSLLYNSTTNKQLKNELDDGLHTKLVVEKLIENYKQDFLANLNEKDKRVKLKRKLNANNLLSNEEYFFNQQLELKDTSNHKIPIGIVCNSGFTLLNGKISANGLILTKYFLDSMTENNNINLTRIDFKTPSSNIYKTAKINQILT